MTVPIPTRADVNLYRLPLPGKVLQLPRVGAVARARNPPALRAQSRLRGTDVENEPTSGSNNALQRKVLRIRQNALRVARGRSHRSLSLEHFYV